jgi:hypothetical protein
VFQEQAEALRERGFGVSLLSVEALQAGTVTVRGQVPAGAVVVYRGWMLTPREYESLIAWLTDSGAKPFTSLEHYVLCHHLPNWYARLIDFTAETAVFSVDVDIEAELRALGWGKVFLKDYVKSLKTSVGSVVSRPEEARAALSEMRRVRGTIEGGICVRRFESFVAGSEQRFFVLRGVAHGVSGAVPELVSMVSERIASPFFAVDVAVRDDGSLRVVEIGDGQVSDLVGWEPDVFAQLWTS